MAEQSQNNLSSVNIHTKHLDNIYEVYKRIENIERLTKEGCQEIGDFIQIPFEQQKFIIPEIQYKNIRFFILELNMFIDELRPILKNKTTNYKMKLNILEKKLIRKDLMEEVRKNGVVVSVELQPLFYVIAKGLSNIKGDLINDIGDILFLEEKEKKRW